MNTTTTSLIILIVIILFLIVNSILLNRASDMLLDKLDKLSDNPCEAAESAEKLEALWKKFEPFISICVTHTKVENVTDAVSKIKIYAEFGEIQDFLIAKEAFKNSVEHIRFSSELSLETIL